MRLLAVLNRPDNAAAVLTAAGLLVSRLGGAITVLHVRMTGGEIPGEEIVPEAERLRREAEANERQAELRAAFEASGLPNAVWREVAGPTRASVAAECGKAELVVLGRPPRRFYEDMHQALRGALLDAGAPVLLMGDTVPAVIGEHIAVAWKPGIPAECAIEATLPLLRKAAHVTVLIANEGADDALPDDLLDELDRAGVSHAIDVFRPDASIGTALSRQARSLGADLLVMGAFSHSQLMERVFGGATQDVINAGLLPVLLRH
jgi:nucleotide-binding universal stress UspA family protein